MNFMAKMQLRMARTGKPYFKLCREMGSAGGKKAAFNKTLRKQALARKEELFHGEQLRQVAMKLRDADEVGPTEQDRQSIALDVRRREARLAAISPILCLLFLIFAPSGCMPALANTGLSGSSKLTIHHKATDGRLASTNLKRAEIKVAFAKPSRVGSNPAPSFLLRCTAYSWREPEHRSFGHLNCMGSSLDDGQCAADLSVFPLGTVLEIPGAGRRTVMDCGSGVCGRHIDLHFGSLADMNAWGSRMLRVRVIRRGWNGAKP